MLYDLFDAQGIKVGSSDRVVTPSPQTTTHTLYDAPTLVAEILIVVLKVDQLNTASTTLTMEESSISPLSTKRARD